MFRQYSVILCVFRCSSKVDNECEEVECADDSSEYDWLIADLTCNVDIFIYVYSISITLLY